MGCDVVLPSTEPRAAWGAKGECLEMRGGGGVHASDPEPRLKRILFLLNTNIYFECKVML